MEAALHIQHHIIASGRSSPARRCAHRATKVDPSSKNAQQILDAARAATHTHTASGLRTARELPPDLPLAETPGPHPMAAQDGLLHRRCRGDKGGGAPARRCAGRQGDKRQHKARCGTWWRPTLNPSTARRSCPGVLRGCGRDAAWAWPVSPALPRALRGAALHKDPGRCSRTWRL